MHEILTDEAKGMNKKLNIYVFSPWIGTHLFCTVF